MKDADNLPFIPAKKLNFEWQATKKIGYLNDAYFKINSSTAFDQNRVAEDEKPTNGYTLFDFSVGADVKIKKQFISIGASVTNVFDTKYIDHLSTLKEVNYFNTGRNISLSVKIPLGIK